ncbi:MAG: hypothetical protein HYZ49_13945 [Chloroflexi bacterium]|nr:hypothetical protein [Chloroflexota bacterium]
MKQTLNWITRERLNTLMLFLLLLASYSYTFPRWADPNQNSRLDMVVAVVDDGTFQIDKYVANTVDYAKVGGHYYSDKAPGAAFLGIPVYAALKVVLDLPVIDGLTERLANSSAFQSTLRSEGSGVLKDKVRFALAQVAITFVVAAIPSALIGVMMYLLLAKFTASAWHRLSVVLIYGLLTPAFAYATAFYGHQLSAALLLGAFYLIFMAGSTPSTKSLLFVGLLLGYSVVTEYPSLLMVGILYLYTLHRLSRLGQWKRIGWVTLTGAVVAAGWMFYNKTVFGGWLSLGYSNSELWVAQHHTGFMSLTLPSLAAVWGITFGGFRGLFVLSPILLLAFPGFWLWWKRGERRAEFWVAVASALSIFLFNSSSIMWWGGFSIGPRYLLPMLPFMTLPLIFVFREWLNQVWARVAVATLSLWSLFALWGLTLAEQAFPSDAIRNPLIEYALPNWIAGNIARNLGTILGFKGASSLLPLAAVLAVIMLGWWWLGRGLEEQVPMTSPVLPVARNVR